MEKFTEKLLTKQLLQCIDCNGRFSILDVMAGKYVVETGICASCYRLRQKHPDTCFGKKTKGRKLGYDETEIECQEFCADRHVCKKFVEKVSKKDSL